MSTLMPFAPSLSSRSPFAIRWTREECARLQADGYLHYRYELVEGDILKKMPQNLPHRIAISLLTAWLYGVFGVLYVQSQAAIDVSPEDNPTSEPEPDIVVLSLPLPDLMAQDRRNPKPGEILLVVEVSDTTLDFDLNTKAGLYARANLPEYWVLNLNARTLHILRDPVAGLYRTITVHSETESVTCLAATAHPVVVATLLP